MVRPNAKVPKKMRFVLPVYTYMFHILSNENLLFAIINSCFLLVNFRSANRVIDQVNRTGRGATDSPSSEMSARSHSVFDKDTSSVIVSNSGGVVLSNYSLQQQQQHHQQQQQQYSSSVIIGAHGYNNEAFIKQPNATCSSNVGKPLKQLVVTAGKTTLQLKTNRGPKRRFLFTLTRPEVKQPTRCQSCHA